jgi:hypothetical protein
MAFGHFFAVTERRGLKGCSAGRGCGQVVTVT